MAVYRKEKSKTKRASGSGAVSVKVWQYAAEMAFVDNKDSTRESTGNLTRTSIENDPPTVASLTTTIDPSDDPNDDPLALPPGLPDDQFSTSFDSSYLEAGKRAHGDFEEYTFDKPKSKKIKMSKSDQFCQLIESIEERKIKAITTVNEQDQDADRLFVLSLLPYLKQV